MININTLKTSKHLLFGLSFFLLLIGILVVCFICLFTDDVGYCLSEAHGVWDYDQNICRHDCLKWTKEDGCIPLNQ